MPEQSRAVESRGFRIEARRTRVPPQRRFRLHSIGIAGACQLGFKAVLKADDSRRLTAVPCTSEALVRRERLSCKPLAAERNARRVPRRFLFSWCGMCLRYLLCE